MFNTDKKLCLVCDKIIPMPRKRDLVKEYCGRRCAAIAYHQNDAIECLFCGLKFNPTTHRKTFCTKHCANKYREKFHVRYCARCGEVFRLENIAYERRGAGQFCSNSCATRKLNIDELFFEQIDNEEKAYWLGFLFADGFQNGQEMIVNLSVKDKLHLEKLKEALKSESEIRERNEINPQVTLRVSSKKLCADLDRHGCVKCKSYIVKYPGHLEPNLERHFIRGVFDGDGCIYRGKKSTTWSIYSESTEFISSIHSVLANNGIAARINNKGRVLGISKKKILPVLSNFLYLGSTIFLNRKRF